MRALLLALALFLAREVQALEQRCATFNAEQLVACLQDCPDAQRGVAVTELPLPTEQGKIRLGRLPSFTGPLVISNVQSGCR